MLGLMFLSMLVATVVVKTPATFLRCHDDLEDYDGPDVGECVDDEDVLLYTGGRVATLATGRQGHLRVAFHFWPQLQRVRPLTSIAVAVAVTVTVTVAMAVARHRVLDLMRVRNGYIT